LIDEDSIDPCQKSTRGRKEDARLQGIRLAAKKGEVTMSARTRSMLDRRIREDVSARHDRDSGCGKSLSGASTRPIRYAALVMREAESVSAHLIDTPIP
jgi:hypothetical protein